MKHIGNLIINDNLDYSHITEVTGNLYIYSKTEMPNLTSVWGCLYINSNGSLVANNLTTVNGKDLNYKIIDDSIFVIQSKKIKDNIKIYKGYNIVGLKNSIPKKELCYFVESEKFFAHGKTIKKAIEDLNFKILSNKLKLNF